MRILHTSDWHIGKKLGRFDRLDEAEAALVDVERVADDRDVELILVSGDVFDRPAPPIEALGMGLRWLLRLAAHRPVIAVAGNIFQDPYESLDPRMTIKEIVAEPLRIQGIAKSEAEILERVKQILSEVEVVPPEEFLQRFPHELSGGQRQRVAVARAFVVNPEFVVADEPVSMLDVSIRAEVLNSMLELVQKRQVSFIYITHDLALAKHVCDRLAIMYLGKIVEMGPTDQVIMNPLHPYTQALIAAVPVPDPDYRRGNLPISGEIPSPLNPPQACRFHTRCPYAFPECTTLEPPLIEAEPGHFVACHMVHK